MFRAHPAVDRMVSLCVSRENPPPLVGDTLALAHIHELPMPEDDSEPVEHSEQPNQDDLGLAIGARPGSRQLGA